MFKKIKQRWIWATNYTVVIVSPGTKHYIVHHRIGRTPTIQVEERRERLRGQSASIFVLDELFEQQKLDDFELPSTGIVYRNKP